MAIFPHGFFSWFIINVHISFDVHLPSAHWLSYYTYSEVRIEGLEILDYLDNLRDKQRFTEQGDALTFESEVKSNDQITVKFCPY